MSGGVFSRRVLVAVLLTAALSLLPGLAFATEGDLYAAGTAYRASTYSGHRSLFGGPEQWVVDINANAGDAGRPIYAPESGSVTLYSSGWGDGYGTSIVWTSADGREQLHVAHLSAVLRTGPVAGGDLIAKAGSTGNSSGDHMHVSRAYDGQPAPLVLSGQEITPGYVGSGLQYYSKGQTPLSLRVDGVLDGMTYYAPVTITYAAGGTGDTSPKCDVDGIPLASGACVTAVGTHRVTVIASAGATTVCKSVTFTIAPPPAPGFEPVFRFYNAAKGTHFFTPSHGERDTVVARYPSVFTYEGVAYWHVPAMNAQPLYRFYNVRSGSHFYTASPSERDSVQSRWSDVYTFEGETYRVSQSDGPKAVGVYRFYNLRNGSHFYTVSAAERDTVLASWPSVYRFEGTAFWIGQ